MARTSKNLDLYGLIGYPVKHSLSPVMHNAAFKYHNISAEYRLFEVKPDELECFLSNSEKEVTDIEGRKVIAGDIIGFNITIPHKVRAKEILTPDDFDKCEMQIENSSLAGIQKDMWYRLVSGAVNTAKREGKKLLCFNTDVGGFLKSLEDDLKFEHTNKNVLLIGCGGAGRAIVAGLSYWSERVNKLYIYEQSQVAVESARAQFAKFGLVDSVVEFISKENIEIKIRDCQLLINASPIGMKEGDFSVIDKELLHKDLFIYDVVYNRETQLLKDAKEKGLFAVGGLNMLVNQGALAWGIWRDKTEPIKVMREAMENKIKEKR